MIFIYVCVYICIDVVAGVLFPLIDKSRISDCCSFQGLVRDLMPNKVLLITGNVSRKKEGGMPMVGCRRWDTERAQTAQIILRVILPDLIATTRAW